MPKVGDAMIICEMCRERLDPAASDTVRAVKVRVTETKGDPEGVERLGLSVFFHARCFPGGSQRYRRKG
jgi:hypothetical protein